LKGVLFGQLGAEPEAKSFYRELEGDPRFKAPIQWGDVDASAYEGMILPGGHAPGMRQYLAGEVLHAKVAALWAREIPVGAICHGVLVLARAKDASGQSLLRGRRTTCLPKYMEAVAYGLTAWKLGRYYRTYPAYVEDEVRASLARPEDFVRGPVNLVSKGTADDDGAAFVVEDGRYVSAHWPGDAYLFAKRFMARL
jgi:putative intracellular protease/amidase